MNMRSLIVVAALLSRAALGQPVDEPPKPSHQAEARAVAPYSRENLHRVFSAHDSDLTSSWTSTRGASSPASGKESQNSKKHA